MFPAFLTTILFSISVVCGHRSAKLIGGTEANFWRLTCATMFLSVWAFGFGIGLGGDAFLVFLVSGIVGLFTTYWLRHAPGFWWSLVSAILALVVGGMLLASPLTGAFSLTLLLIAFFIVEGAASIMFAFDHKRELSGRWGWMLVSGIIDLALALMIFAGLPSTAAWALGLLVGINMIFGGTALIAMSLYARKGDA